MESTNMKVVNGVSLFEYQVIDIEGFVHFVWATSRFEAMSILRGNTTPYTV